MTSEAEKIRDGLKREDLPLYNQPYYLDSARELLLDKKIMSLDEFRFAYPGFDYRVAPPVGSRVKVWLNAFDRISSRSRYSFIHGDWLIVKLIYAGDGIYEPYLICTTEQEKEEDRINVVLYYNEVQFVSSGLDYQLKKGPLVPIN